jgi:YidC/Oxa1 family membrane protein insertase
MALYKEHGINPLGGCLPLLVQMPILLGLYQAIILALAGTPYQLMGLSGRLLVPGLDHLVPLNNMWIGMDLTKAPSANPSYALAFPVLVMATTWLQSKLTMPAPAKSDDDTPNQAANMTKSMTTIMPLMFGFFSLSFSVGISVYFVMSNLVGITQYTLMGKAEWGQLLGRFAGPNEEAGKAPSVVEGKVSPVAEDGKRQRASSDDGKSRETGGESLPPKRKKKARKMKKKAPGSAS